ncbi:MAG: hypothetical protein IJ064_04425 [Bacteroidaceae bacterium]|nr:hypothetical protein [Bacteroidaceae bacterium]
MKKLFLSMVALMMATLSFAQSSLIATLSHEGEVKTYYSASALIDAHDAAVDGDIITLSSGTFNAVDFNKKLTIRGAGMEPNTLTGTLPTIISGDFEVREENTIEGIYHNGTITAGAKYATFIKCRLKGVVRKYYFGYIGWKNYSFINCRITTLLSVKSNTSSTKASVSCINCIVNYPETDLSSNSGKYYTSFDFTNCIVSRGNWGDRDFFNATMKNCIYIENGLKASLDASHSLYNTVCVYAAQNDIDLLANVTNGTNTAVEGYSNVFATYSSFTPEFPDNETFALTDAAKAQYLGLDGTQVGIYGGIMPFDPTVSGPQITKCNVASKSTADGKLSVEIEVNGGK